MRYRKTNSGNGTGCIGKTDRINNSRILPGSRMDLESGRVLDKKPVNKDGVQKALHQHQDQLIKQGNASTENQSLWKKKVSNNQKTNKSCSRQ